MPDCDLYYLLLDRSDMPAGTGWLSPRESAVCDTFRFPKRRGDWLLGRWTAKQALLRLAQDKQGHPADWEILADESGAPVPHREAMPRLPGLSLSHSNDRCLCTVSYAPVRQGCDIERVEPRSASFEETYFETDEIEMMDTFPEERRALAVTLAWSAKESVLKALRLGLSADTRRARILHLGKAVACSWHPLNAFDMKEEKAYSGWWKESAGMVMTVAADAPTSEPVPL